MTFSVLRARVARHLSPGSRELLPFSENASAVADARVDHRRHLIQEWAAYERAYGRPHPGRNR